LYKRQLRSSNLLHLIEITIKDEGTIDLGMDEIVDLVEDLEFGRSGG